jgi:5-methyltetrahydrofolate--homocysteine methyltransferase
MNMGILEDERSCTKASLSREDFFNLGGSTMNKKDFTNRRFLDALSDRVMVFDGAMGTNLQLMNLTADNFGGEKLVGCNDHLVLSYPQAPAAVHTSFLEAGVDVIETCTFRSNRLTLHEYGLDDKVNTINKAAATLARGLADKYSTPEKPRFVAGSIGPTGKLPSMNDPELSNISVDELVDIFCEQATGLIEGGVDLLLVETSQDILEVKTSIWGIEKAFTNTGKRLPIQVQVTLDTSGRMLLGTDISAVLAILEGFQIDVIGLNCSTGPEHMREPIQYLGENSSKPVSCIPNAGLPLNVDGQAVYPLTPQDFASDLIEFVEKYHINVVGGCCGTTPQHLEQLVKNLGKHEQSIRSSRSTTQLSSAIQAQDMRQEPAPFLIGERLNTQGSAKFKQLILAEEYDSVLSIARQQVNNGAHGLDICVALTERQDEPETIKKVIKSLASVVRVPFIIDTTELEVMETALKNAPGRCLINSTNLESGRDKADKVFALAKKYNAAVIALTIDEKGMAKTAERKVEIAKRIYSIAVNDHSIAPSDLVFDALTFTLATGDPEYANSAMETFKAIREIKEALPGVLTSLGVSNVSFGLNPAARGVINSIMLYHAVQAGLDMAIVNPAQITPYNDISEEQRNLVEDLILNRTADALQKITKYFSKVDESIILNQNISPLIDKSAEERLHWRIVHRVKENLEADIDEIINRNSSEKKSETAVVILNTVLLPAMKEVGDKFGTGELILPFVLQSAEVMKKAVSHLETYLEKAEGVSKGTVVLATVYGDVHDIGKNLVKTILSNNGYSVIDLGKQVPAETIISKAVEVNASAIGLSALLVSTSKQMPLIVNDLQRRGLKFPVLIGGAAINRRFGRRIIQTESGDLYAPGVFYCKDAFEGLNVMDQLVDPVKRSLLVDQNRKDFESELNRQKLAVESSYPSARSATQPATFIPQPKIWGPRVVRSLPLESVFMHLGKNELFRLSWGAKNTHGDAWEKLRTEFENRLEKMKRDAIREKWLNPQAVYGYWPVQSDGNDLVIYDPQAWASGHKAELTRFTFPRQNFGEHLCLSDYFSPITGDSMDVAAFQVVTVGQPATQKFDALQATNEYSEAYFIHGLSVQTAEAAADYLHSHIRAELGLSPNQGNRYSWGYPAIPELSDHKKVFELLPAEKELGMQLTDAYQLVPEQSTAAIILHHPDAKYFNVVEGRSEIV